MNKPKFNVGDKVKIANPRSYRELLKDRIDEIESVYTFEKFFETEYRLKDCSNVIFESELELIPTTEYKVAIFKPGDKVEVVVETHPTSQEPQYIGKIFTIKDVNTGDADVSHYKYKVEETSRIFCGYELKLAETKRILKIQEITKEDYEELPVKDLNTLYIIKTKEELYSINEINERINKEMKKEFTLDSLRSGDVVKHKNGQVAIFIALGGVGSFVLKNGYLHIGQYNNDLTTTQEDKGWDIVAIRRPESPYQCQYCAIDKGYGALVYERKEVEEMTLEEVCKALGKEIKIVKEKKQ